jgi:hypothetical protein
MLNRFRDMFLIVVFVHNRICQKISP